MHCSHDRNNPVAGCRACEIMHKHYKLHGITNITPINPNAQQRKINLPNSSFGRKPGNPVCVSRGGVLRQSSCDYCSLKHIKIDVRSCDIHVACIDEFDARYRVRGVKKCQECEHYKSPTSIDKSSTMSTVQQPVLNPVVSRVTTQPVYTKTFAFGITTIPERRTTTLPITIRSLTNAGFDNPILFIDDRDDGGWGLEYDMTIAPPYLSLRKVFRTDGRIKAFGHWILSLYELFIRNPHADLYALFQDDIIVSRNLRLYLDRVTLPNRGYLNLYTFPSNQKVAPSTTGFYRSNQNGKGATALVFDRESIVALLTSPHILTKLRSRNHRAWKSIDGGIIQAFKDANPVGHWHEYVHNPSLVQHIGTQANGHQSTLGNPEHLLAPSFMGEDFDCSSLLPKP